MMKKLFLLALLGLAHFRTIAQDCDRIIGKWLNKGGEGQVEIYQRGNQYFGKLVWLKYACDEHAHPPTDQHNINPALRKRQLLGLVVMKGFICGGSNYSGGTMYDPRRGKSFTGVLTIHGNRLKVDAMMGMFPAGSETWTRVKA